jgi:hypothetical protein
MGQPGSLPVAGNYGTLRIVPKAILTRAPSDALVAICIVRSDMAAAQGVRTDTDVGDAYESKRPHVVATGGHSEGPRQTKLCDFVRRWIELRLENFKIPLKRVLVL